MISLMALNSKLEKLGLDTVYDEDGEGYKIYGDQWANDDWFFNEPKILVYKLEGEDKYDQVCGIIESGEKCVVIHSWGSRTKSFTSPKELANYVSDIVSQAEEEG